MWSTNADALPKSCGAVDDRRRNTENRSVPMTTDSLLRKIVRQQLRRSPENRSVADARLRAEPVVALRLRAATRFPVTTPVRRALTLSVVRA